jgi:hypothetical protein
LKTIVYHQRLGDVLQCLPAARYLAQQDEVQIECLPQYAGVMDLVSYATWVAPGQGTGERIDLEIWPNRYNAFRQSGLSWMDFVYQHPTIAEADRKIVLDRVPDGPPAGLPDKYNLLAPHGISHGWHYPLNKIMQKAEEMMGSYFLMHAPCHCYYSVPHWSAGSIVEMAQAIKHADLFMAINSAPIVMASSLRQDGKETFYLPQKGQWAQDNVAPWPRRVDVEL